MKTHSTLCFFVMLMLGYTALYSQATNVDSTYGTNGVVRLFINTGELSDMAVQADDKLVITGYASNGQNACLMVGRLKENGTLDSGFAQTGVVKTFCTGSYGRKLFIQDDQKILVVGEVWSNQTAMDVVVLRYMPDGTPDYSFGGGYGYKILNHIPIHMETQSVYGVLLMRNGKILISGQSQNSWPDEMFMTRLHSNGSIDSTFGINGLLTDSVWVGAGSSLLAEQADGKILTLSVKDGDPFDDTLVFKRLLDDGSADISFGPRGEVIDFRYSLDNGTPIGLKILNDGKILTSLNVPASWIYRLAKYLPNGTPDLSFNSTGYSDTAYTSGGSWAGFDMQHDGKIVSGGTAQSLFATTARFLPNGSRDMDFGANGVTITNEPLDVSKVLKLQQDGKILLGGNYLGYKIMRFLPATGNCAAYFSVSPDSSTEGVYYGYNLSTGNNLSYLWDFGDGSTSALPYPTHTYAIPAQYLVCLTINAGNGCTSTFCDSSFYTFKTDGGLMSQLQIIGPASVDNVEEGKSCIYPNPTTGWFTLKLPQDDVDGLATIVDLTGKKVIQKKLQGGTSLWDVSALHSGVYFLRINNTNGASEILTFTIQDK